MTKEVKETKAIALVRAQAHNIVVSAEELNIQTQDDAHYASGQLTFIAEANTSMTKM